jgi:monofunctional biosynthetic peptidoglycan transglycosylase
MKRLILVPLLLTTAFLVFMFWLDSPSRGKVPRPEALVRENPRTTALMEIRRAQALAAKRRAPGPLSWTPLSKISPFLQDAVISAEDGRFYVHHGVEWGLVKDAFIENWKAGKPVRGASTITQQVAKNLYLTPRKSYVRKARELLAVLRMERALPKKRILEIYLNVAEWGDGIFGAEAAAETYYGVHASDLTLEQAVGLASILPSPLRHHPGDGSIWTTWREGWVQQQMKICGRWPAEATVKKKDASNPPAEEQEEELP